jgi:hypothetical protein
MARKISQTTFKVKSSENLIAFLKKFSLVESSLLLEITADSLLAKSNTADKSILKYSKIKLDSVLEGTVPGEGIKIGIGSISRIVNVFKYFGSGEEIFLELKYEEINDELVGVDMTFHTDTLKINLPCQDLTLFTYVNAEMLKKIIKNVSDEKIMDFDFPKEEFIKIQSLCDMDSDAELIRLKAKDSKLFVCGKSFEYEMKNAPAIAKNIELAFRNENFGRIDSEFSRFHVSPNRILVKSNDTDTMIILGRTE